MYDKKDRIVYIRRRFLILAILPLLLWGCNQKNTSDGLPVLTPEESLKHFQLEEGLAIHLVAAEPLVQAPIAIQFDARGRIWAVEMMGYMPDTAGTGESVNPDGKIVILEDKDNDGRMDSRKVFLDSLILPRAICFYDSGLLVAEPPNLWFVEIKNDKAGTKYLVDSQYAVGGNVEHQPNGLLRGLDNWIYSAKSDVRYRRVKGKWLKEHTHFRGQWGITQDNFGRLFYNNNSVNLLGDYFLPGLGAGNPNQRNVAGFNETIVGDNRTYPIHPTPGVNRGYRPKVLDDSLRLNHFTAACGPVIYRSRLLGAEYRGNAFVAGPAANLVKRDILHRDGFVVKGKQAYQNKEFLASDDERFRPVNLYNGPEGALYVVDMYRGIIQDVTYLTPYLKQHIVKHDLANPLNRGRIYKVTPEGKNPPLPDLRNKTTEELVQLLNSPDAWISATAQRLLVDHKKTAAVPLLRDQLQKDTSLLGKIRTLWTLEGLGQIADSTLRNFLFSGNIKLQQQAVAVIVSGMNKRNALKWLVQGTRLYEKNNKNLAPYLGFLAAEAISYEPVKARAFLEQLAGRYPDDPYVVGAVISGLPGKEKAFFQKIKARSSDTGSVLYQQLEKVVVRAETRKEEQKKAIENRFAKGKQLFMTYCKICHGEGGEGLQSLGPPLAGSQWVTGSKETLLAIVLHGLTGPVQVGDRLYQTPEIAGEMPGFAQNDKLSDQDIAQILSFIRSAWSNNAGSVSEAEVKQARERYKDRAQPFTMETLRQLTGKQNN